MENLTQRWIKSGPFFQNKGSFFDFQKRAGEVSPPSPLNVCLGFYMLATLAFNELSVRTLR